MIVAHHVGWNWVSGGVGLEIIFAWAAVSLLLVSLTHWVNRHDDSAEHRASRKKQPRL